MIGLACAHYLLIAGRKVCVIEKETLGSGASHGNCGLVFTSDLLPMCAPGAIRAEILRKIHGTTALYFKPIPDPGLLAWLLMFAGKCNRRHLQHAVSARDSLLRHSRWLYDKLLADGRIHCDWAEKGILMVYKDARLMEKYAGTNAILEPYGLGASPVVGRELHALEPALKYDVYGAWHHSADTHLRPDSLIKSWSTELRNKGADIVEECEVLSLEATRGRITGALTSKGRYAFDTCVMAAGAWSPGLTRPLSIKLPIQPGKGYSITMSRPTPCPEIPCYFCERKVVATPFSNGYRLGSIMEFSGFDLTLKRQRLAYLRRVAGEYLKSPVGDRVEEEWTSLRPMTYDDLPIIGPAPEHKNLFLATGHGMTGISMAPGTGKLIAELITGQAPHIDPAPYRVERF